MRFIAMPFITVDDTNPTLVFIRRRNMAERKLRNIPHAVIAPPNIMAERMSHMVLSMPAMPDVDTKLLNIGSPVSIDVEEASVATMPLNVSATL